MAAGEPYELPPPRPGGSQAEPTLCADVAIDSESLALGMATAAELRGKADAAEQTSRKGQLNRALKRAVKRCEGILRKLESQLVEVAKADDFERKGDLIKNSLGSLPR
ncbi:MAG: hypothetical protein IIA35_08265, partial [Proteobacteria bacterium]|nr:hypothetical protein [Pseudomonadota bacterium]